MASLNYNKAVDKIIRGQIDFDTDSFKCMLVTSAYAPNKDTDEFRTTPTTNEVGASGTYAAGGIAVTATVQAINTTSDYVEVVFSSPSWTSATITARAAVIYKVVGTAATDPLVSYVDFGSDVTSTNGTFTVTFSTNLRFQN